MTRITFTKYKVQILGLGLDLKFLVKKSFEKSKANLNASPKYLYKCDDADADTKSQNSSDIWQKADPVLPLLAAEEKNCLSFPKYFQNSNVFFIGVVLMVKFWKEIGVSPDNSKVWFDVWNRFVVLIQNLLAPDVRLS